jgi:hypothetical protein
LGMMMMNHNMLLISFLLQLKWLLRWQKLQEKETQFQPNCWQVSEHLTLDVLCIFYM